MSLYTSTYPHQLKQKILKTENSVKCVRTLHHEHNKRYNSVDFDFDLATYLVFQAHYRANQMFSVILQQKQGSSVRTRIFLARHLMDQVYNFELHVSANSQQLIQKTLNVLIACFPSENTLEARLNRAWECEELETPTDENLSLRPGITKG